MSKKEKNNVVTDNEDVQIKDPGTSEKKSKKADPMAELQAEIDAEKDRYLRLFAEFENYKKRTGRERIELFRTASQDVMVSLLPVLDDFDRALKEIEKGSNEEVLTGVELISHKLRETLRGKGLEPIETSQGEVFDAEIHEAVTQIPAPEENLKGKIIEVLEKGYTLGDKIIRFPKVVIGQ
jgi:molecular chaperone GrpE